jgi:hypothetical protein
MTSGRITLETWHHREDLLALQVLACLMKRVADD